MTEEKKTPQIRFKGFNDPWEQRKLGEVARIFDGTHQTPNYTDYGIRFVSVESIKDFETKKYISELDYEKEYKNKPAEIGDVLMTRIGDIGTAKLINTPDKLAYYVTLALLKPVGIDGLFLATSINSRFVQSELWKRTLHIAFPKKINLGELSDVGVFIPSLVEQKKIAAVFSNLDTLITLHQRKHDKLTVLKKSMLEKMFPKDGTDVPEVRFAGFTNPWEQRKLGEVAGRYDNLRIPITAKDRIPGSTPYYGANGIQDYVDGFTHEGEFVLIAEDGASDLSDYPVQLISGLSWVNNHAHVIKAFEECATNSFLLHTLKSIDISSVLVGGTRAKLNADILMKLELRIPKIEEQAAVSQFLNCLDTLITLHQRELDILKRIKTSCLEKMLV